MAQAHEFLRNFCLSNPQNQALLHKHLDLFLTPGVSKFIDTCCSMFQTSGGKKTILPQTVDDKHPKTIRTSPIRLGALKILCYLAGADLEGAEGAAAPVFSCIFVKKKY